MPITYTPIQTQIGDGSASTITFSSIPSTYTDLILVANVFTTANANQVLRVNGDSTSGLYSTTYLTGNGTVGSSGRYTAQNALTIQSNIYATTTIPAFHIMQFNDYANTNKYKTVATRAGKADQGTEAFVGLWRNTNAITSISISGGTFTTNAAFTLYGIKAA